MYIHCSDMSKLFLATFFMFLFNVLIIAAEDTKSTCKSFECPPGEIIRTKDGPPPKQNGCGPKRFPVPDWMLAHKNVTECCNAHDLCYGTCGRTRDDCDKTLGKCIHDLCTTSNFGTLRKIYCQASSKIFREITNLGGCRIYKKLQERHCECVPAA